MVPVLDRDKKPLMPCSEKRAKKLMEKGKAKPYWCKGVFCIILQVEPKTRYMQDVVVGIDPGSKFEGLTVKTEAHTLLNVQTEAKTDVSIKIDVRSSLRRSRRSRCTPYRKCRFNRSRNKGYIPPSTKARWDYKISLVNWFRKMYPVTMVSIEDITARTKKGAKKWNRNFSPIEVGKNYFRDFILNNELKLFEFKGYETAEMRKSYNLKKNSNKSKQDFYTHCVDSWCIANEVIGGHTEVDNTKTIFLSPIKIYKRQLHVQKPIKGNIRKNFGSTRSMGIERGTLVKHPKWGFCLVGGNSKNRLSMHRLSDNKRLCQNARKEDLKILTTLKWNIEI
jgi:hypothetical protein